MNKDDLDRLIKRLLVKAETASRAITDWSNPSSDSDEAETVNALVEAVAILVLLRNDFDRPKGEGR